MNLNELKSMIAKEYKSYMAEQAAATPSVDVDATDVDATDGDENPEETLRDIYDMLKDYFEGGDAADTADAADTDMADDADDAGDEEDAEALQERFKKLANIIKG